MSFAASALRYVPILFATSPVLLCGHYLKNNVNHLLLHQVASCIVGNQGMRNAMLSKFPCGQPCTLVPWSCLIDPHMKRNALIVCQVDRGSYRSVIDVGKPSGVAMCENVKRLSILFFTQLFINFQSVFAYLYAVIFFCSQISIALSGLFRTARFG